MSECQLYEFVALEQSLDAKALKYVRDLSSRAHVTATHALFTYSYGNFPADPLNVLAKHYDMLLYMANWGTRQLAFRFSKGTLDAKALAPYYNGTDEIEIKTVGQYEILDITIRDNEGGGEWLSDEGQIAPLIALRGDLMRGDLRLLYLAWLAAAIEEDQLEPPVPAGLNELSAPLRAFIEFIGIDQDLVVAAARASAPLKATKEPIEEWLRLLPATERDAFLLRAAQGELINGPLLRRLRELGGATWPDISTDSRRSLGEIIERAEEVQRLRKQRERAEAEKARLAKLAKLAKREAMTWGEVAGYLTTRKAYGYDKAVELLGELHELAVHEKRVDAFNKRLQEVLEPYAKSKALQERLKRRGLL
jgi:hypothetical protein